MATTIAINIEVHEAPMSINWDVETATIALINLTAAAAMEALNAGQDATGMIAVQR
jgi:hypothetical protein